MCSDNQVKYVAKLAKWKKVDIDLDEVSKKSTEEVSQLIDELKAQKSPGKKDPANASNQVPVGINGVRFGLACKLVLQESTTDYFLENPGEFNSKVKQVYDLLNEAEEAIRASSRGE